VPGLQQIPPHCFGLPPNYSRITSKKKITSLLEDVFFIELCLFCCGAACKTFTNFQEKKSTSIFLLLFSFYNNRVGKKNLKWCTVQSSRNQIWGWKILLVKQIKIEDQVLR
jgi:hypothetical protein